MCKKLFSSFLHFRPKLSEKIQIDVKSTENLSQLVYQVLAKGDVLVSEIVSISNTSNFQFELKPTFAMVPKANLVAFYITPDGEIISDSLKLEFDNELKNFVSQELN